MYRYLFVIAGEARRMRVALAARGYRPRHALQAAAIGRVATALFLRTFERGERVYVAMLARGYAGATPRLRALAFGARRRAVPGRARRGAAAAAGDDRGDVMSCAIEARGLRFRYPNGVAGLDGVDLSRRATASASRCSARTAPARRR